MSFLSNRSLRTLTLVSLLTASPLVGAPAAAQKTPASPEQKGETIKIAVTPADHLALAKEYAAKAATYRKEAAVHRKMLDEYLSQAVTERAEIDPGRKQMRAHCQGYIDKAEALAVEAEKFADFHRMRAAELQGK